MSKNQDLLTIEEYSEDEFKQLTWEQYGKILDNLYNQISNYAKKNAIKFDAIVPILRGGMIAATYLAGKFKILRIIPVQYKYFIKDKQVYLKKLLPLSKDTKLKKNPNILIVENCYCFGTTTKIAIEDVKKHFPTAKTYVAADRMDYTFQKVEGTEKVFYGELNNDTKKLSEKEYKRLGVDPTQYYYPWETLDEEIAACQLKQYSYSDLKDSEKNSKVVAHFDFSR